MEGELKMKQKSLILLLAMVTILSGCTKRKENQSPMAELQAEGIVTKECEVNEVTLNEDDTMIIDINKAFADYIRSMGTTGEEEILSYLAESYLSSYQKEKLKITEEGALFETGHMAYEDYYQFE